MMTGMSERQGRRGTINETARTVALAAIALLLVAILAVLITLAWRGLRIDHTGTVAIGGMSDAIPLEMTGPITLTMPEPARLIATGPDGAPILAEFAVLSCPTCGGGMVPTRWNLLTGKIDWVCPSCGETITAPAHADD